MDPHWDDRARQEAPAMPSLLDRSFHQAAIIKAQGRPLLITTVDVEEQFDWSAPLSRYNHQIASMEPFKLTQKIFDTYGVTPSYFLTYPVVADAEACRVLRHYYTAGKCEIGAQLHPWVTPPFDEVVNAHNSFPGNLSAESEREKLTVLTELIAERVGVRPTIYRAGRYGIGPNTAEILKQLGYKIDSSVVPEHGFSGEGGPDFFEFSSVPFWLGPGRELLEIPITSSYLGVLATCNSRVLRAFFSEQERHRVARSAAARLRIAERMRLTPEGTNFKEARRLVKTLLRKGSRVFTLSYHSPSLIPGATPYVRNLADRDRLLHWLESFYDFFFAEMGGQPATTSTIFDLAAQPDHAITGPVS
jgi:hypothetical protein